MAVGSGDAAQHDAVAHAEKQAEVEAEMEAEMDAVLDANEEEVEAKLEAEVEAEGEAEVDLKQAEMETELEAEMDAVLDEMARAADPTLHELIGVAERLSELVVHPNVGCALCGMQPLIGSRFVKRQREDEAAIDLCTACFLGQPETQRAHFSEMTHPTQACHDHYEWVPGCVAREDEREEPDVRAAEDTGADGASDDSGSSMGEDAAQLQEETWLSGPYHDLRER